MARIDGGRRATVLVNRQARGVRRGFDGEKVVAYLGRHGVEARLEWPDSPREAVRVAADSAERDDDLLVAVGGDGTLREAAVGLRGSRTALAAIPAGTANVWARECGLPRGLWRSLEAHVNGQVVAMDLGLAGEHCFLLMAGVGWDAEVARQVSLPLKRRIGGLAYMVEAAALFPRLRPYTVEWEADGEEVSRPLGWMVLGNTRLYGGRVRLTADATVSDGRLDMVAMCPASGWGAARIVGNMSIGRLKRDRDVVEGRFASVEVTTPGLAVQLDGDYAGDTPMRFSVDPGGLLVSVPAGPLPPLFG